MTRQIITTSDGSQTLYVPGLNEHYHSVHGAIQESEHVYISAALSKIDKAEITVFEMGFGTGLDALLAYRYAFQHKKKIHYIGIEKYPLSENEFLLLNYEDSLDLPESNILFRMHSSPSEEDVEISDFFLLKKIHADITDFDFTFPVDVCFYDAFAPDIQPDLWSIEIFSKIYQAMNPGGILSTYSAKGLVRRSLLEVGFSVEKLPGPPHKHHILRAVKRVL
ncbi:MAG: tRNA (5-methylaminomethyl-2-thiouridine)(34)-methyltransferase MnmD [Bacteroidales bacterium]|nr:tRNA (5-methylaminomethyl-2-thiouridine)(34)-methyltransferase MnmD [Bacteroidales bacterium]MCF8458332.1 tRNA (5-methylaminomethyl-2-thiouridine)(34)-methyltransferase MnmD [Bacteroidales bacterium]